MRYRITEYLLKKLYKFLIFKTIVLNKTSACAYRKMIPFCEVTIDTDKGSFTFVFKEDRRKKNRAKFGFLYLNNYVVELTVPEGIMSLNHVIENKVVIVVKVMLFKVDYKLFTEVLTDIYLDTILKYINAEELPARL